MHYSDNSKQTIYHCGNKFIRSDNRQWYKMEYEQASRLESIIEKFDLKTLMTKDRADKFTA